MFRIINTTTELLINTELLIKPLKYSLFSQEHVLGFQIQSF